MNWVDALLLVAVLSSILRGFQVGFIRQGLSTTGFVLGLILGSQLGTFVSDSLNTTSEAFVSLFVLLLSAFGLMTVGEVIGMKLKSRVVHPHTHRVDGIFGSLVSVMTLILGIWLLAAMVVLLPPSPVQEAARTSQIVHSINRTLPPANSFLSALNQLVDPNAFPAVFTGREPSPDATLNAPNTTQFKLAREKAVASIVKIEGFGCGGIVDGTGFVFAKNRIATNAHVVAGVKNPKIITSKGTYNASVVLFDSENDFAVLKTSIDAPVLPIDYRVAERATGVLLSGYPEGGSYREQLGVILDRFTALGLDIYGQGRTLRDVYSLQGTVVQGNSGGPVITQDGRVIGVVFATSTTYNNIGYALTAKQVQSQFQKGAKATQPISTTQCST